MSTIYVVTEGEYSDYSIVAVFDNREQAEALVSDRRGSYHEREIEEWELNPAYTDYAALGYSRFTVHMAQDGTVLHVEKDVKDLYMDAASFSWHGNDTIYTNHQCLSRRQDLDLMQLHLHVSRIEKDEARVVKIANEKRIQLLAENRWKLYEVA